jgi:hypothetical protein
MARLRLCGCTSLPRRRRCGSFSSVRSVMYFSSGAPRQSTCNRVLVSLPRRSAGNNCCHAQSHNRTLNTAHCPRLLACSLLYPTHAAPRHSTTAFAFYWYAKTNFGQHPHTDSTLHGTALTPSLHPPTPVHRPPSAGQRRRWAILF